MSTHDKIKMNDKIEIKASLSVRKWLSVMGFLDSRVQEFENEFFIYKHYSSSVVYVERHFTVEEKKEYITKLFSNTGKMLEASASFKAIIPKIIVLAIPEFFQAARVTDVDKSVSYRRVTISNVLTFAGHDVQYRSKSDNVVNDFFKFIDGMVDLSKRIQDEETSKGAINSVFDRMAKESLTDTNNISLINKARDVIKETIAVYKVHA